MHEKQVPQLTREQAELINAGFLPRRYAAPVRLLRRLLWPFIRPFHFHTLDQIQKFAHLNEEVERLVLLQSNLRAEVAHLNEEVERLVLLQSILRAEVVTLDQIQKFAHLNEEVERLVLLQSNLRAEVVAL